MLSAGNKSTKCLVIIRKLFWSKFFTILWAHSKNFWIFSKSTSKGWSGKDEVPWTGTNGKSNISEVTHEASKSSLGVFSRKQVKSSFSLMTSCDRDEQPRLFPISRARDNDSSTEIAAQGVVWLALCRIMLKNLNTVSFYVSFNFFSSHCYLHTSQWDCKSELYSEEACVFEHSVMITCNYLKFGFEWQ